MRVLFLVVLSWLPTLVAGQSLPLPALYDVAGVASNDVLNVRSEPTAKSGIIGVLAPDAKGVEVVDLGPDLDWGRVNVDGMSGWASMAYLARQPGQGFGQFPEIAACFGTEPFWSITREPGANAASWTYSSMDGPDHALGAEQVIPATGRADRWGVRFGQGDRSGVAVVALETCSDGMSDRGFGITLDLIFDGTNGSPGMISGCCSLSR